MQLWSGCFQPFFCGEVRKSQQGLVLGLYIVSEIDRANSGDISVNSSEDETRFILCMFKAIAMPHRLLMGALRNALLPEPIRLSHISKIEETRRSRRY
jgi:hypothetical protein